MGFSKYVVKSLQNQISVIQMFSQYYNSSVFEQIAESKISAQKRTEQIYLPMMPTFLGIGFPVNWLGVFHSTVILIFIF